MSARARRILLVGEEHIREKVARHYDLLRDIGGFETHYYLDDRSGITRELAKGRPLDLHFAPDPSAGPRAVLRYWASFVRCFEKVRPDVLEVYTAIHFAVLLPMVLYAAARGVPRVVVCRGELYPPIYNSFSKLMRGSLHRILQAASLIVYKELYMDEMLAKISPGTPRILWTNAIPLRDEPRYERSGNVVLFLNFFKDWRNLDVVVRAAPAVRAAVPDAEFELVGGSDDLAGASRFYQDLHDYEQGIRALIEELGVGDFVRIRPFTNEVDPYFERAKVYVLPADLVFCNYGLLEAMERGVPPVVSADRDPDARRIVEDGVSGRVAPISPEGLADAVIALLADEPARQRMARGARARIAAEYNLEAMAQKLADEYERLAGASSAPAGARADSAPVSRGV